MSQGPEVRPVRLAAEDGRQREVVLERWGGARSPDALEAKVRNFAFHLRSTGSIKMF